MYFLALAPYVLLRTGWLLYFILIQGCTHKLLTCTYFEHWLLMYFSGLAGYFISWLTKAKTFKFLDSALFLPD